MRGARRVPFDVERGLRFVDGDRRRRRPAALHGDAVLRRVVRHDAHFARRSASGSSLMRLISAVPREVAENSSSHRDDAGLGADDVIERFERFAFGEGLDLGLRVEPLLQAGQSVGGPINTIRDDTERRVYHGYNRSGVATGDRPQLRGRRQALRIRHRGRRSRPQSAARRMLWPARAERRRQDHDHRNSRRSAARRRRRGAGARPAVGQRCRRAAAAPGHPAAGDAAGRQADRRRDAAAVSIVLSARPDGRRAARHRRAGAEARRVGRRNCRAGRSSGCRWRARWRAGPTCCFSTSRPPASIRSRAGNCGRCSSGFAKPAAPS